MDGWMGRFWAKVNLHAGVPAYAPGLGECWGWTAATNNSGYGAFRLGNKVRRAHRVSYEFEYGTIPEELEIDHRCRKRDCVRPTHLEAVTHVENVRRGKRGETGKHERDKTACPQGHPYDEVNTYHYRGGRLCRACDRARKRVYSARAKRAGATV